MVSLARFFGRTVGEGAGVAIGTATGKGVEPAVQELANTMEEHFAHRPIDPKDAAALRAREQRPDYPGIDLGRVNPSKEAAYGGMRQARFDALTELEREHPSVGELITLRRRRLALGGDHGISQDEFREWLRRGGFTTSVIDALTKLLTTFLPPEVIANAVQQGFVPDDGILPPGDLTGGPYTVPAEQVAIDPSDEAAVAGLDKDRLTVLAQLSGNPPGPMELLEMWRRTIITEGDVERGIREGRTKTKWTKAFKALVNQLLPPSVLVNLRLRGYIEDDTFHDRMELHGYNATQANDWFLSSGRPLAPQQMLDLIARKGPAPGGGIFGWDDFDKGMVESDIKPKYSAPAHALYYKYPPLFQLRRAVESGGLSKDRAAEIMHIERYEPQDIQSLLDSWEVKADATTSGYTDKAKTQLWTTAHRSYVAFESNKTQAGAALARLGVPTAERADVLALWDAERDLIRRQLTPAQVKKAYLKPVRNPLTGANWTRDDALAALLERGYSTADANTFLDE